MCCSVRILPEKYDSHPLNLQRLQPIKVSLGPETILERPSKRSSVTAMSVLRSANPDTTQRIKHMSSSTEVCTHPYYLKVIRFRGFNASIETWFLVDERGRSWIKIFLSNLLKNLTNTWIKTTLR